MKAVRLLVRSRGPAALAASLLLFAACGPAAPSVPGKPAPTATSVPRSALQQGQPASDQARGAGGPAQATRAAARVPAPAAPGKTRAEPTPPAVSSRTTIPVRRGTIIETIKAVGRLAPAREAGLYFRSRGRLETLYVESGQSVQEGQLLAELDKAELTLQLQRARLAVEQAQLNVERSRAKVIADDTEVERLSIQTAEGNLGQARLALQDLRAKPLEADIKAAESSVVTAEAALGRAVADLAGKRVELAGRESELEAKVAGATPLEIATGRWALESELLQLQKLREGPRPEELRAAELGVDQARVKLAQVRDAPKVTAQDIEAARIAVQQAMVGLEKALAQSRERGADPTQSDAAVKTARITLEREQNNYIRVVTSRATPWETRQAELALEAAEHTLAKAKAVDPDAIRLQELKVQQAEAKLNSLVAGATEQDLAATRLQVDNLRAAVANAEASIAHAQAAVAAARAKVELVLRGPAADELHAAEGKVVLAERGMAAAQEKLESKTGSLMESQVQRSLELKMLETAVESAGQDVLKQEALLDEATIVAPFRGKITRIRNKPGDDVNAFNVVIDIQNPDRPLVRVEIPEQQFPKLTVGQRADVTLDSFPGQVLRGQVVQAPGVTITQSGRLVDKVGKIAVEWTRPGAEIGQTARVQIVVERKDDVLIIPLQTLRTVGKRTFVEFMDGNVKRSRNVITGIASDTEVEIASGVQEGMPVVLAQ